MKDEAEAAPRRRRSRRAAPRAAVAEAAEVPAAVQTEEAPPAPRRSRRTRSRATPVEESPSLAFDTPVEIPVTDAYTLEAPSADRDVGADTAKNHAADEATTALSGPEPTKAAEAEEPALTTETNAATEQASAPEPAADEPSRPKRSGWWQRAKATITGE